MQLEKASGAKGYANASGVKWSTEKKPVILQIFNADCIPGYVLQRYRLPHRNVSRQGVVINRRAAADPSLSRGPPADRPGIT